jgi:hypothetical protein
MILVAMSYANNLLNLKMAENEYSSNKQFMLTSGQQIDDIAWTIGRTQTVSYSSKFGAIKFEEAALTYTFQVHNQSSGLWETLTTWQTGVILFNMPVSAYSLGNGYFDRVPSSANSSFLLPGSTASITQVICEEKLPMNDGSYNRIVLVPTLRLLNSTVGSTNYFKFYSPSLENGTNLYRSQSVTLTGGGISKISCSDIDQVNITVSFPKAVSLGFDSSFFNFNSTTITLNGASTPAVTSGSVVEFYVGKVVVAIGQV